MCSQEIFSSVERHKKYCDGKGKRKLRPKLLGRGRAWNKGNKLSDEQKAKISLSLKGKKLGRASTPEKEALRKQKISQSLKGRTGGYRKGSGRGKSGWYKGYWCDSSWELAFVVYNLDHRILFKRNTEKFPYLYDGRLSYYIPDFILGSVYIEIKGYDTAKNKAKYAAFSKQLRVFKWNVIQYMVKYVKQTYGNHFISLYEGRRYQKRKQHINCSSCDGSMDRDSRMCKSCWNTLRATTKLLISKQKGNKKVHVPRKTKIIWPKPEEVLELVQKNNYRQAGKLLGISDNAIRKFLKKNKTNLENFGMMASPSVLKTDAPANTAVEIPTPSFAS